MAERTMSPPPTTGGSVARPPTAGCPYSSEFLAAQQARLLAERELLAGILQVAGLWGVTATGAAAEASLADANVAAVARDDIRGAPTDPPRPWDDPVPDGSPPGSPLPDDPLPDGSLSGDPLPDDPLLDGPQSLTADELATDLQTIGAFLLRELDDALGRLQDGTYGWDPTRAVWLREDRLRSLPWARQELTRPVCTEPNGQVRASAPGAGSTLSASDGQAPASGPDAGSGPSEPDGQVPGSGPDAESGLSKPADSS